MSKFKIMYRESDGKYTLVRRTFMFFWVFADRHGRLSNHVYNKSSYKFPHIHDANLYATLAEAKERIEIINAVNNAVKSQARKGRWLPVNWYKFGGWGTWRATGLEIQPTGWPVRVRFLHPPPNLRVSQSSIRDLYLVWLRYGFICPSVDIWLSVYWQMRTVFDASLRLICRNQTKYKFALLFYRFRNLDSLAVHHIARLV